MSDSTISSINFVGSKFGVALRGVEPQPVALISLV